MSNPVLVVMAAGLGSRYGGLKQVEPVGPNGQIIMHYSIYDAHKAGFNRVVFIIKEENHDIFQERIGSYAESIGMKIDYVYQTVDKLPEGYAAPEGRTKPLGTGHAVYCVCGLFREPFAVINADDFYGADAFRQIYDYLASAQDDDRYRYCMVGYQIENTLTENGTVSRGVCTADESGNLASITERLKIGRREDGSIFDPEAGVIEQGTPVSMNMWGFTPSFMDELEAGLIDYLNGKLLTDPMKAEFFLPTAVNDLIQSGKATAKLLTTTAQWYGVTYPEDRPVIIEALKRMTNEGIYPAE